MANTKKIGTRAFPEWVSWSLFGLFCIAGAVITFVIVVICGVILFLCTLIRYDIMIPKTRSAWRSFRENW